MIPNQIQHDEPVEPQEPAPLEQQDSDSIMSFMEHLEELRRRLIRCVIAIVLGSVVAFFFREQILRFLLLPLPAEAVSLNVSGVHYPLAVTGVGEPFTVFLKLSVAVGIGASVPVLLYELWAFVTPGLTVRERHWAGPFLLMGLLLFVVGMTLGFMTLRFPIRWLIAFGKQDFLELVSADNYFTFVAFFLLAFGIVFELPLILTFLAQMGLLSSERLRRKRVGAWVLLWILSTFLTPGTDPYSPIILGSAMTLLYEGSILMIRATGK